MAWHIDPAPAKLFPVKKRHCQTFKKEYHEECSLVTANKKGDACMNSEVCSTVGK